jgi:hypothetical protein
MFRVSAHTKTTAKIIARPSWHTLFRRPIIGNLPSPDSRLRSFISMATRDNVCLLGLKISGQWQKIDYVYSTFLVVHQRLGIVLAPVLWLRKRLGDRHVWPLSQTTHSYPFLSAQVLWRAWTQIFPFFFFFFFSVVYDTMKNMHMINGVWKGYTWLFFAL